SSDWCSPQAPYQAHQLLQARYSSLKRTNTSGQQHGALNSLINDTQGRSEFLPPRLRVTKVEFFSSTLTNRLSPLIMIQLSKNRPPSPSVRHRRLARAHQHTLPKGALTIEVEGCQTGVSLKCPTERSDSIGSDFIV